MHIQKTYNKTCICQYISCYIEVYNYKTITWIQAWISFSKVCSQALPDILGYVFYLLYKFPIF